ncbi:MAG: PqqD family protein [Gemmatimonadetes bacterium]|nr:PqqD family protein [Gemmatimonadota bacterium]
MLLHTESEIYFGLNEVGVLIWESLPPECADLEGLCERISARYPDVDLETIRADAVELIETLEEKQLVTKEG